VDAVQYDERLRAPVWIWLVTAVLAVTFGFAFGVYFGIVPGSVITVVVEALVAWRLVTAAAQVSVGGGVVTAGRARLPYDVVGDVTPLDRAAAQHLRGRGADPRAFMLLRPWVDRAVRIDLNDPKDPTPYWYVSTRRPGKLAAAIGAAAFPRGTDSADDGSGSERTGS
jgi:hypothetical protein